MTLEAGTKLGRYEILSRLGAGGMGEVFLAEDAELGRKAALKVLHASVAADDERIRRFVQEAKAASALNHPNILTIYEIGQAGGPPFIAAEFIEGETLREKIKAGSLSMADALDIAEQVGSALQAAHRAGIIHRDIKPENVMIRGDGYVKVLDFGLAKLIEKAPADGAAPTRMQLLTDSGAILGTVAYMSPEQARGVHVDEQSDIFSFGVILYEMLTGKQPFTGETINHTIVAIIENEPPALSQFLMDPPVEIQRIVDKCLAKNADKRYGTAKDLLADLKAFREELSFQSKLERGFERSGRSDAATQTGIAGTMVARAREQNNSIAVLSFANMSADAENEYFCDGLAEELLNALANINGLRVAARTSAFSFKDKNVEVSRIGKTLNVKTILEGSVRKSGNRLRITVQLINASDGYHLWSERYDREMRDIFDIQDEITLAVVKALKVKLLGEEKSVFPRRYTEDTDAYDLYLKGRYHYNKYTPDDFQKAIEYFKSAIAIEPKHAPAYAGIGFCYGALFYLGTVAPVEIVPRWRELIDKALEIDGRLAGAYLSRAAIEFYYDWDFEKAERDYKKAIELTPNDPDAHWRYGNFLVNLGRFDEAVTACKKALALDPLSVVLRFFVARIYGIVHRFDESFEQVRKILEIQPNFGGAYAQLGGLYMMKEQYAEAIAAYKKALDLSGFTIATWAYLGAAYMGAGKIVEAYKALDQLLDMSEVRYVSPFTIAIAYAGLGENDLAFEWFEKAYAEHSGGMVALEAETRAGLIGALTRQDPRFEELIRRVGLPKSEDEKVRR